ncbi:MAG: hypothetical protein OEX19_10875 [Gammaproteobacteria bacterium]|nr:hypothetical protein [Gammaproteobacteria bacterium]
MAKKPSRRGQKKELLKRFDDNFDLGRLNLVARVKLIKPKAMLVGLLASMILYGIGFTVAYVGMSANSLPLEVFAKLVWMMMIPTTIIGFFVWQLSRNRMEFPIRREIREYISEIESVGGMLWRFAPILQDELDDTPVVKKAFAWSAEGKIDKLDIDDYILAVESLERVLHGAKSNSFTPDLVSEVESNFSQNTSQNADAA